MGCVNGWICTVIEQAKVGGNGGDEMGAIVGGYTGVHSPKFSGEETGTAQQHRILLQRWNFDELG